MRRITNQATRPRRARPVRPPTTPPTMGPIGVDDCWLLAELESEDGGWVVIPRSEVGEREEAREDGEDKDGDALEVEVAEETKAVGM